VSKQESKNRKGIRRASIVGGAFGAAMVASFAFASWVGNGSFWAPGQTASSIDHLQVIGSVDDQLWPGDCSDVSIQVTNPNPKPVKLTGFWYDGFRNVSDTAPSVSGNANRLEDFLYQNTDPTVMHSLDGKVLAAGATRSFTVPNSVCLRPDVDNPRVNQTFQSGMTVTFEVVPGNEANN
jgi:hypothetical protein